MAQQLFRFISHLLRAQSRFGIHSPLVYEFVTQVLPHRKSNWGKRINQVRREKGKSNLELEIKDLGAGYGGRQEKNTQKRLSEIVRSSARKRRNGELLYRICSWHQTQLGLELGTNLGFSTAYQAAGIGETGKLITIEGSPSLSQQAELLLQGLELEAEFVIGDFKEELKRLNAENIRLDYVLMDGNHQYEPTMDYFDLLVKCMNPNGLIIVDDINWSKGMRRAWQAIKARDDVQVTIDLFFMGLCFVNRQQAKEDFRLRFWP